MNNLALSATFFILTAVAGLQGRSFFAVMGGDWGPVLYLLCITIFIALGSLFAHRASKGKYKMIGTILFVIGIPLAIWFLSVTVLTVWMDGASFFGP